MITGCFEFLIADLLDCDNRTVRHATHEWSRDDDEDELHKVHVTTLKDLWTAVRNFLRPFQGVHIPNLRAA